MKSTKADQQKSHAEDPHASSGALEYFRAAKKWDELIDDAKVQTPHFAVYWKASKRRLLATNNAKKLSSGELLRDDVFCEHFCEKFPGDYQNILKRYHETCWLPGYPMPECMRIDLYKQNHLEKMVLKAKIGQPPSGKAKDDENDAKSLLSLERDAQHPDFKDITRQNLESITSTIN